MEDLSQFCCQNRDCPDYGKVNAGNLTVCGRFGKNKHIRLLYCRSCKYRFSERKGTPLFGSRLDDQKMATILNHISEGCGVRKTSRLVGVHRDTVSRYISVAGNRAKELYREISADIPNHKVILATGTASKVNITESPGPQSNISESPQAESQPPEPAESSPVFADRIVARGNQTVPPPQKSSAPEEKDDIPPTPYKMAW